MRRQRIIGKLAFKDKTNDTIIPLDMACEIVLAGKYWWARVFVGQTKGQWFVRQTKGQWQLQNHETIENMLRESS